MTGNLGGRPPLCADANGQRCGNCRNCKRTEKRRRKEAGKLAMEVQRRLDEMSGVAPTLTLVCDDEAMVEPEDMSLVHETSSNLTKKTCSIESPCDWSGWGPEKAEEPVDEHKQKAQDDRAKRREHPSAAAQMASAALLKLVRSCAESCAELGKPWPMWGQDEVWKQVWTGLAKSYSNCFADLLPDVEAPMWADHAVTGVSALAALGSVTLARKANHMTTDDVQRGSEQGSAESIDEAVWGMTQ